jgi:hypothetical protein
LLPGDYFPRINAPSIGKIISTANHDDFYVLRCGAANLATLGKKDSGFPPAFKYNYTMLHQILWEQKVGLNR